MIGIIAAVSANGVIGKNGKIPFHYPEDFQHFKETTLNSVVVMGRKTYESMGSKPLPHRVNIVVSSQNIFLDHPTNPVWSENNYYDAMKTAGKYAELNRNFAKDIWIIGGSSLYEEALYNGVDKIVLTITPDHVNTRKGEIVRFPWIDPNKYAVYNKGNMKTTKGDLDIITYSAYYHDEDGMYVSYL